jgi:hypothetical protein
MNFRVIGLLAALAVGIVSWALTCAAWRFDEVAAGVRPLEPRRFEHLTLITLGTGGAHEDHNRRGPATAVAVGERVLLVDAGRCVAESLRVAQIPVSQPDTVLLTNLLPENTLGLDDLLAMAWIDGRREPLELRGPRARGVWASNPRRRVSRWRRSATRGAPSSASCACARADCPAAPSKHWPTASSGATAARR